MILACLAGVALAAVALAAALYRWLAPYSTIRRPYVDLRRRGFS